MLYFFYIQALFRMYKLRRLILTDNEVLDISPEIGNLISLEELDISKNGMCFIDLLCSYNFLYFHYILFCYSYHFCIVFSFFGIFYSIASLLSYFFLDFRIIPDEIEKLKNLTYLDISSNTLGE